MAFPWGRALLCSGLYRILGGILIYQPLYPRSKFNAIPSNADHNHPSPCLIFNDKLNTITYQKCYKNINSGFDI